MSKRSFLLVIAVLQFFSLSVSGIATLNVITSQKRSKSVKFYDNRTGKTVKVTSRVYTIDITAREYPAEGELVGATIKYWFFDVTKKGGVLHKSDYRVIVDNSVHVTNENEMKITRSCPYTSGSRNYAGWLVRLCRKDGTVISEKASANPLKSLIKNPTVAVKQSPSPQKNVTVRSESDARKVAMELYPSLKTKGSALNLAVKGATRILRKTNPGYLENPSWPLTLSKMCNDALSRNLEQKQVRQKSAQQGLLQQAALIHALLPLIPDPEIREKAKIGADVLVAMNKQPMPAFSQLSEGAVTLSFIEDEFDGFEWDKVFKLDNGQIWVQEDVTFYFTYKFHPKAAIYRDAGSDWLVVEGVPVAARVKQLR